MLYCYCDQWLGRISPYKNLDTLAFCMSGGKTKFQRSPHLHNGTRCVVIIGDGYKLNNDKDKNWLKYIDSAHLESDGAASLKSGVTDSKTSCPRYIIRSIVVMEAVTWWILQLSTYKFERQNFRTGRRIAPKFGTHVPIDTLTLL